MTSTKKQSQLFPGVLCIPSPVIHGMTTGCTELNEKVRSMHCPVITVTTSSEHAFTGDHGCPCVDQEQLRRLLFSNAFCIYVSIYLSLCVYMFSV